MIEVGHEHFLRPVAVFPRPDGTQAVHSQCGCGLEEELVQDAEGGTSRVRYRYGGLWFSALDLLRMLPLPVIECQACHGEARQFIVCPACGGAGVTAHNGSRLVAPELRVV